MKMNQQIMNWALRLCKEKKIRILWTLCDKNRANDIIHDHDIWTNLIFSILFPVAEIRFLLHHVHTDANPAKTAHVPIIRCDQMVLWIVCEYRWVTHYPALWNGVLIRMFNLKIDNIKVTILSQLNARRHGCPHSVIVYSIEPAKCSFPEWIYRPTADSPVTTETPPLTIKQFFVALIKGEAMGFMQPKQMPI